MRVSNLGPTPEFAARIEISPGARSFFPRTLILVIFAAFGSIGFGRSLAALLGMSTILSAVIGTLRREPPFDVVLNHWDETVAYAALFALVSSFNHPVPI